MSSVSSYKRPGSSTVYYDNNNNENYPPSHSTHSPPANQNSYYPTSNYENSNYDKEYEKTRLNHKNSKTFQKNYSPDVNNTADQLYDHSKSFDLNNQIEKQSNQKFRNQPNDESYNQQSIQQQQQQIYQQPQSSIKFEQPFKRVELNRQQYRSVPQDLNYRTSNQNNYYHQSRSNPTHHQQQTPNNRPFQVTIIPFIQYITQLPTTNDYQISNDKQLLDTISQSLHNAPLISSPDAWLPIKAYTTTDLQQKEFDEHLANDRISNDELASDGLSSDELNSEYTTNYRDKRSTACNNSIENSNSNKNNKSNKNKSEKQSDGIDDDENSSITRVKKQAGFDEEPEGLCQTKRLFITPKAALNDKSEWRYIVNVGERDARLKQVILYKDFKLRIFNFKIYFFFLLNQVIKVDVCA